MLMRVRQEQAEALARATVETFEDNVSGHLRRVWPDETKEMTDEAVVEWVRWGVSFGGRYAIETEYDVARLCDLMFLYGAELDRQPAIPWLIEILEAGGLTGRQKVDQMMERARQDLDAMTAALSDEEGG